MKLKCEVCGERNGSCNQYITREGRGITICPSCLMFGNDAIAKMARQAHKEGLLIKPERGTKKK